MAEAVCIRCGARKSAPWRVCDRCGYDPTIDDDALLKSVYLSAGRFSEPDKKKRYRSELDRIAVSIEQGKQPTFDEVELLRLKAQKALVGSVPTSVVWRAVLRFFLPAIGLLILLFGLAYLIRKLG